MKKRSGSFYVMALVVILFAASLVVPLSQGKSPIDLGLDLSGGVIVTYRPDFSSRLDAYTDMSEEELLALAKETLSSRLRRSLNTLPDVVVRGDKTIVVSIAGGDHRRVLDLVGETYHLTFRLVESSSTEAVVGAVRYRDRYLRLLPAEFSGDMLDERYIQVNVGSSGSSVAPRPEVAFRFRAPHDDAFAEFTRRHVGREMAILLDDTVQWSGQIESAITETGVLSGSYNMQEANEIAMLLRSGSMPVALEVESLSAVGPSLGQEIQELGLEVLVLSLVLLVFLITIAYLHRGFFLIAGLVSLFCLFLFISGLAALFGLTLDMVGIAGIILSVGMGMDAFIIVFESFETKLRGVSSRQYAADHDGFSRRMYSFRNEGRTLFHANATTLIVVLLLLATERLRSFALFIFVGILASLLTILVTRFVLQRGHGWIGDIAFDPLAWLRRFRPRLFTRRKAYLAALVLAALVAVFLAAEGGRPLVLGDDFHAGTQLEVISHDGEKLEAAFAELTAKVPDAPLRHQRLGDPEEGRYLVHLGTTLGTQLGADNERRLDIQALNAILGTHGVELGSVESIDSKVSGERLVKSLSVLFLSFFFLALYFVVLQEPINRFFTPGVRSSSRWVRQRVLMGILLAVLADLVVVVAVLVILGIPISLPVVAAVLTIIGYSVNDSVVLWSHIQKGQATAAKGEDAYEIVTRSVDGILSRAWLTSLSTMVPALVILAVGLEPLRDFAWVMIAGTVAGTLSSIFVVGSFAARALSVDAKRHRKVTPPLPLGEGVGK